MPTPADIVASIPDVKGETEQCWHYLARDFVKDIQGETVEPYPTFNKGSQYQQLIDLIRKNQNWTNVLCERQVQLKGPDAEMLVQLMTPRDLSKAQPDQCFYVPLCDERGQILNDPIAIKISDDT